MHAAQTSLRGTYSLKPCKTKFLHTAGGMQVVCRISLLDAIDYFTGKNFLYITGTGNITYSTDNRKLSFLPYGIVISNAVLFFLLYFFVRFRKKGIDFFVRLSYNRICVTANRQNFGVWHSLASVPDLGSGGRRFESCHPDW